MSTQHKATDVILIGGGIMSATLGTLLKNYHLREKLNYLRD